jgi:hypothetical protein
LRPKARDPSATKTGGLRRDNRIASARTAAVEDARIRTWNSCLMALTFIVRPASKTDMLVDKGKWQALSLSCVSRDVPLRTSQAGIRLSRRGEASFLHADRRALVMLLNVARSDVSGAHDAD